MLDDSAVLVPLQIVDAPVILAVGFVETVTLWLAVREQPVWLAP